MLTDTKTIHAVIESYQKYNFGPLIVESSYYYKTWSDVARTRSI